MLHTCETSRCLHNGRSAPGSHCVLIWRKSRNGEHRSGLATEGAICIEQCAEQNKLRALMSCTCTVLPV